jgi:hypothetical protein
MYLEFHVSTLIIMGIVCLVTGICIGMGVAGGHI